MKKITALIMVLSLVACKNTTSTKPDDSAKAKEQTETPTQTAADVPDGYASYGDLITTENTWSGDKFLKNIAELAPEDTLNIKVTADVKSVCQKKGCWMKLKLPENKNTFVRFKDYGFFMPKDIKDQNVIVRGKAYVKKQSVKDLRHYAKDAGKSKQEVEKITDPKRTYAFMADGVLVKK